MSVDTKHCRSAAYCKTSCQHAGLQPVITDVYAIHLNVGGVTLWLVLQTTGHTSTSVLAALPSWLFELLAHKTVLVLQMRAL